LSDQGVSQAGDDDSIDLVRYLVVGDKTHQENFWKARISNSLEGASPPLWRPHDTCYLKNLETVRGCELLHQSKKDPETPDGMEALTQT